MALLNDFLNNGKMVVTGQTQAQSIFLKTELKVSPETEITTENDFSNLNDNLVTVKQIKDYIALLRS